MVFKITAGFFFLLVLTACATENYTRIGLKSFDKANKTEIHHYFLRQKAFCDCLRTGDPATFKDYIVKDGSGFGFLDFTNYSPMTADSIRLFSQRYITKIADTLMVSKFENRVLIMKCLRFYESDELNKEIRKYDAEIKDMKLK